MEAAAETRLIIRLIFFLEVWKISMQLATRVSIIDTEEVRAANKTIRKKTSPRIPPAAPIASKTFGSETNIRLGPEAIPSVPKKTNTEGMIINPAKKATIVSKISIWLKERLKSISFFT